MTDLWRLSAAQLAAGYRSGAFTPVDAIEACLARTAHCQPLTNAMVMVDRVGARQAAGASRLRWARGRQHGPLDGVPVSIKDNLHVAGLPTTWGSQLLKGFVARADELPVARLRAAGAVIMGKTNLPEFAMQGYTSNLMAGTSRNPWDLALTPGGSSGGAAAAVASGCAPIALTTDGGGSSRRPASHTGVAGFKPSAGRVPRGGGTPEIFLDYEVAGGIARTVEDLQLLLQVLAPGTPMPAAAAGAVAPSRILYVPLFGEHPMDPDITERVRDAAAQFAGLGHVVEQAQRFPYAERINAMWPLLSSTGLAWMLGEAERWPEFGLPPGGLPDIALCTDSIQAVLRDGLAAEGAALFELLAGVRVLQHALQSVFAHHDFILTPATAALPWPAEATHPGYIDGQLVGPRGHAVFTAFANAAGLPAIALPCGFIGGLPTGFQLLGPPGSDDALLALARQYEQAHPWAAHWPPLGQASD
jgi:aspartyl-tRNA(Asn)/glutamyl-tRNA(Gln) amidotransferase subunit A